MASFSYRIAVTLLVLATNLQTAQGAEERSPCTEDAMIVFDASGSMSGNGWGYGSETAGTVSRIDKVRATLANILPSVTRHRRVGLITYGPGVWDQCNVRLDLKPEANSAERIMTAIKALTPAGKTPLTAAVAKAAEVLDYRAKPALIVLLTDGEETCGGSPCELGKKLSSEAASLTVHVIGLRVKGYTWMGEQSLVETKCLAERNGGLYLTVETEDELREAFEKTLGCPMVTDLQSKGSSAGRSTWATRAATVASRRRRSCSRDRRWSPSLTSVSSTSSEPSRSTRSSACRHGPSGSRMPCRMRTGRSSASAFSPIKCLRPSSIMRRVMG
jgi:Ca-activated chloride channel family protein